MELKEMITRRKSTRNLTGEPVAAATLEEIRTFMGQMKPLFPEIRFRAEIVDAADVRCMQPWKTPHFIAIYTEDSREARMSAGFLFQQMDLYLQSLGLGCCWVGLGRPRKESEAAKAAGLTFTILMPFGHGETQVWRDDLSQFSRKPLSEISDQPDPRLEPARLAPSATNSQPWYFVHQGENLHVYQVVPPAMKRLTIGRMNQIDMGIVLCHLWLTAQTEFRFHVRTDAPDIKGYEYMGTIPAK